MTAPERIWAWTSGQAAGIFDTSFHDNVGSAIEYIRAAIEPQPDPRDEVITRLVGALDSIDQYGSDTLSGNTRGPDDRAWQRDGVIEMVKRARAALAAAKAVQHG